MEVVLAGVTGDRYRVFWERIMRCGVTGRPNDRSDLLRRAAAGEVGADAGTTGTERECLCMTTVGTYDTHKDMSKRDVTSAMRRHKGSAKLP